MASTRTALTAALGAALITTAGTVAATTGSATAVTAAAPDCGVLFDDFSYSSPGDAAFSAHGWVARSNAGGPGVAGAAWSASNISFPVVDGEKVAQLSATTDGTAAGTSQAEFLSTQQRFLEGTYASRIKFHDAPTAGPDGDHVNETFFAIGPAQRFSYDPLYSELDFSEYLPNGGWGVEESINYQTSYNGYSEEPWDPRNAHSSQAGSIDGWHDLVTQVAAGHVKYYIDGTLVGDHTVDDKTGQYTVYPRVPMSLNFNLWFIDTAAHTGGTSTYTEQVDWVYYKKNAVVAPAEVVAQAGGFRSTGQSHTDSLDSGTGCTSATPTPTPTPTTPTPTPTPTTTPTPTPTPTGPVTCGGAAEWAWGTTYLGGERSRHNGHLWQANWWTLGSEPGVTAQWRDLGPC